MQDHRRVPGLQGASNFRDLGGYRGRDGRPLRWGRLFRSDQLSGLTAADRERLRPLGLTRAFDFRGTQERAAQPYALPGLTQYSLAIEPTVAQNMAALVAAGLPLSAERMTELMEELYRRLVDDEAHRFAEWFGHLLDDDAPQVFHCTAGKDRTGFASALLLTLLGVPWETVMDDYLRTNELWTGHLGRYPELDIDTRAAIVEARTPYLEAAFEVVRADFGGPEQFAERALSLDRAARERLRADLLD